MNKIDVPDNIHALAVAARNKNFNILDPKIYTKHKITDQ